MKNGLNGLSYYGLNGFCWEPNGYDSYLLVDNRATSEVKIDIGSYTITKISGRTEFEVYINDVLLNKTKSFDSAREWAEKRYRGESICYRLNMLLEMIERRLLYSPPDEKYVRKIIDKYAIIPYIDIKLAEEEKTKLNLLYKEYKTVDNNK